MIYRSGDNRSEMGFQEAKIPTPCLFVGLAFAGSPVAPPWKCEKTQLRHGGTTVQNFMLISCTTAEKSLGGETRNKQTANLRYGGWQPNPKTNWH